MSKIIDVSATAIQDDRSGWQAEDGIRDSGMSRGLGDAYKRQSSERSCLPRKMVARF